MASPATRHPLTGYSSSNSDGALAGGAASTGVRTALRLEGLGLLVAATVAYFQLGFSGLHYGVLFLVPDVSLAGYLAGSRIGAAAYNAAHSMIGPLTLAAVGIVALPAVVPYALIWLAHIGFDRALGYGLKYAVGFQLTHLGRIGKS